MKLYLHIGTEKTGSSFLQSYLANHRELLNRHGIYYPSGGIQEANMKKGIITPGNAHVLNTLIEKEQWNEVKKWLIKKQAQAKKIQCNCLLLSNEILSITLSKNNFLLKFKEVTKDCNLIIQPMLLMIRDPVSQALSLYKHRSKQGHLVPIKEWLEKRYFLADSLIDFYDKLEEHNLNIKQYLYAKDSKYLVDVCINGWLNLNQNIEVQHKAVNPSLTLSELTVLCEIHKNDKILSSKFHKHMSSIDINVKSDDKIYKQYIKTHINNYMVNFNDLWKRSMSYMENQSNTIYYRPLELKEAELIISFSNQQIKAITDFMFYSKSLNFRLYKIYINFKKLILKYTPTVIVESRKKYLNR